MTADSPGAQALFADLVKNHLGPAARVEGMKGSGQSWRLEDEGTGNLGLVQWQRSRSSDAKQVEFSGNLAVFSARVWELIVEFDPWRKKPGIGHTSPWSARLGQLLPTRKDTWWTVGTADDVDRVANQLVPIIRTIAVPALESRLSDAALLADLKQRGSRHVWDEIQLAILLPEGSRERQEVLQRLDERARVDPRPPNLGDWVSRLGGI